MVVLSVFEEMLEPQFFLEFQTNIILQILGFHIYIVQRLISPIRDDTVLCLRFPGVPTKNASLRTTYGGFDVTLIM